MPETAVISVSFDEAPPKPLALQRKGRLDEAALVCAQQDGPPGQRGHDRVDAVQITIRP
jgi:hypothetical protein